MGYVATAHAAEDTEIMLSVRGKLLPAKITKLPFVPTDYYKAG
jgi:aminomethyltransferase